ncbi:uncharacterized protein LOC130625953 [Hydractinia symbiolongicarpus]|uniref:uncharacterized protein LOC130625953 n=1 Tax=Hydractinia symbiolongicarpus TaxID=13093 RepID=UPI00254DE931|nr:uncharacterized protein LOC130625953 [Hydractinia symbiolongicarpus]
MVRIISRCPSVTALHLTTIPFGNPSKAFTTYMPKQSKLFGLSTLVISQMKSHVSPMRSEFISLLLSKLVPVRSKFLSNYVSTVLPVRTELISLHVSKIYSLRWSTVSVSFQSEIMETIETTKSSLRMTLEATRIRINMTKTITWITSPPKITATTKSTITTTPFTKVTTTTKTTSSVITPSLTKKPSIPPTTTISTTSSPSKGKMKVIIIATVTPLIAAMCLLAVGICIKSRKGIRDKVVKSNQVVPTKIVVGGKERYNNNNTDTFTPPSDISMKQLTEMTRQQATYKKL